MDIKKIAERLDIPIESAIIIKGIIAGTISPKQFPGAIKYAEECYTPPSHLELKLYAINDILNGCGVESIQDNNINIHYVNLGDTYTTTILYDNNCNIFRYCSWGDFLEENEEENFDEFTDENDGAYN